MQKSQLCQCRSSLSQERLFLIAAYFPLHKRSGSTMKSCIRWGERMKQKKQEAAVAAAAIPVDQSFQKLSRKRQARLVSHLGISPLLGWMSFVCRSEFQSRFSKDFRKLVRSTNRRSTRLQGQITSTVQQCLDFVTDWLLRQAKQTREKRGHCKNYTLRPLQSRVYPVEHINWVGGCRHCRSL